MVGRLALDPTLTREAALALERSNLGYLAGYDSFEVRQRVEALFQAVHPIFGTTAKGPVTPEVAFTLGQAYATNRQFGPR